MIRVNNLSYRYGTHQVLNDVNFELTSGCAYPLVGINGAGKSTLLRCLAGWQRPDDGTIHAGDVSLDDERLYRGQVQFVPDVPGFFDELTAWEHIQLVTDLHHVVNWEEKARRYLDQFQLQSSKDVYPFTFSRGMKTKLALILCLIINPPVFILDEPLGPLDPAARQQAVQLFQQLQKQGATILFSTHDMESLAEFSTCLVLHDGYIQPRPVESDEDLRAIPGFMA